MKILELPIPRSMLKALPELLIKNEQLKKSADEIEVLVIGHSQGGHGFDPQHFPHSFNLCSRSQDAKMSFELYEKVGADLPNLKRIVLFYSFISPGFLTEKVESERTIAVAFNEVYKLGCEFEDDALELLARDVEGLFDNMNWDHEADGYSAYSGYVQNMSSEYFDNTYWQRRRLPQLHAFNSLNVTDHYLGKTIALAQQRGHMIYCVVAPCRSDMVKGVPSPPAHLHRHLLDALPKFGLRAEEVYEDLYCDTRFLDEYFADFTHLQMGGKGPELLTKSVRDMVERAERGPV